MRTLILAGVVGLAACSTPAAHLNSHTFYSGKESCPGNATPVYRTHEGERRFMGCLNYNDVTRLVR